jgi:hypothetical protein
MRQYILMLTLLAVPAITAIEEKEEQENRIPLAKEEQKNQVMLVAADGGEIVVSRDIAEKIPAIDVNTAEAIRVFGHVAEPGAAEIFASIRPLQSIVTIINEVYNNALVLEKDPEFFAKTDDHPAFTPADIPRQVRQIITKQVGEQQQNALTQAANSLGLDWIVQAIKNTEHQSIADIIVYNELPQVVYNELSLHNKHLTSVAGMHLIDNKTLQNIRVLDLKNNQLQELQPGAFNGLNNLETLSLDNNKLKELQPDTFNGSNNLEILDLKNNQLKELRPNAFSGLNNLEILALDNNKLKKLQPDTFNTLNSLENLSLDNNQLQELQSGAFNTLNSLELLQLSHNKLKELQPELFNELQNIEMIGLGKNQIQKLQPRVFNGLQKLTGLDLSDNQLSQENQNQLKQVLSEVLIFF